MSGQNGAAVEERAEVQVNEKTGAVAIKASRAAYRVISNLKTERSKSLGRQVTMAEALDLLLKIQNEPQQA
jgi:hypothetical protein